MKLRRACALAVLLGAMTAGAQAAPRLLGKSALLQLLATNPPCCVIDARSRAARTERPLEDALVYRPKMKINPTATVVVVGDSDAKAMAAARALDKLHPGKSIVGVQGGFPVWESILIDKAHDVGVQGSLSFVIPKNTCEQDTPLQTLMRGKP